MWAFLPNSQLTNITILSLQVVYNQWTIILKILQTIYMDFLLIKFKMKNLQLYFYITYVRGSGRGLMLK